MFTRPTRFLIALTMFVVLVPGLAPPATAQNASAATAAATSSACPTSMNMYWEIGDVNGVIASGRRGLLAPQRTGMMVLASASKWVLGAYMLEVNGGPAPKAQRDVARMLGGYPDFDYAVCQSANTVAECFHRIGNHTHDPVLDGTFFYSGANSQYLATDSSLLDLGSLTISELSTKMQDTLGITMSYQYPALSAGLEANAETYAEFLKKLVMSHPVV